MSDDGLATTLANGPRPDETGEIPTLVDRFLIEDEIGAGGMGRVYLAYDPSLDRKVAIKILIEGVGVDREKASERMAREARAMARLRHPNVVTIYEVGTPAQGGVFLVMEYAPGGTLRDWLRREPTWQQIVQMYTYAGRGLAAAHDSGLVHRDFKPDNVLVGDDGRVQVTDFGIANIGDPSEPAGAVVGTPAYMSPEQHRGRPVDARSDQFAFCAALYEALYGVRPFAGETSDEISKHAIAGTITPPARDRGAPERLRDAIVRGLQPDPGKRFPSMTELLAAIAVPAPQSRFRLAGIAGLVIVAGVIAYVATRPTAAPVKPAGLVAIESFELRLGDHAGRYEWREAIGDVIAITLADIDGFRTIGPSKLLGPEGAREARGRTDTPAFGALEARAGAEYLVRGKLEDRGGEIFASVVVTRVDGTELARITRRAATLWPLVDAVTIAIADAVSPGATLPAGTARARTLQAAGEAHLRDNDFQMARPFLEHAVRADPALFDAWYSLMLVRSWVLAPERDVFAALDTASASAPSPLDRQLVDGIGAYLHHDLPASRRILEGLIAEGSLSKQATRDALYFLGEAHWHDGHHRAAITYFKQALDLDLRFKLPISHLNEYATANRDVAMLNQYAPMIATTTRDYRDTAELVAGHYDQLAADPASPQYVAALGVLDRQPTPEFEAAWEARGEPDLPIYRAARAYAAGDDATAKREVDKVWAGIEARVELDDTHYYLLRLLGDTLLAAGARDEVKRLIAFLAARSTDHPVRSYQRLSILAAGLLGDRGLIVRRELTDREATLADAIEAELAGDRAKAVVLLHQLIDDPSPYWEYPERVALLRNLEASKRLDEARAMCVDTLRPAIFQWAFFPTRRACKRVM